jgi:hypothetical protein
MKRCLLVLTLVFAVGLGLEGVTHAKSSKSAPNVQGPPGVTYKGGDGRDCKHAVIIKGSQGEAMDAEAEAKWLEARYPGYKKVKQQVTGGFGVGAKGSSIDSLNEQIFITTADGQEKTVCFGFAKGQAKH